MSSQKSKAQSNSVKKGSQNGANQKIANKVSQSQQIQLPKPQLEELSQAVDFTTGKFDKLIKNSQELAQKSAQNPGDLQNAQENINLQIEEQGFNIISSIFDRLGGQNAIMNYLEKKHPHLQDRAQASLNEKSQDQISAKGSNKQGSQMASTSPKSSYAGFQGLQVKSHVTNMKRSAIAANGMVQPFDQVMSNFAMYGLANRHALSGPVDNSPASQTAMMQELSGLCLKIYRSVNLRFQRIAQMMLSGNTQELKDLIQTNFQYKMQSYQSLVLTRISENCLMVDQPSKKIGIIDERALIKQHELETPEGNGLRSTLQVRNYIFCGYSNGLLQRLDSETLELDMTILLHTHVFCLEQFDDDHIICGQMNGWVDLVKIEDGTVVLSKELKHVTGNITMILPTGRDNEVMLGTQRGIYFALIGRGLGIMEVEMERFDKIQGKISKRILDDDQQSLRVPAGSERAEMTTAGAKMTEIDGMSQMSFHTQSQFQKEVIDHQIDDEVTSKLSGPQTVYTKPFTVQSGKNSNLSKMQQSYQSKNQTEIPRQVDQNAIIKKKEKQESNIPERQSERSSGEAIGTIAQTENVKSNSVSKAGKSQQFQSASILKNSLAVKKSPQNGVLNQSQQKSPSKLSGGIAESQDLVMQSQNSNAISAKLKQVRHADQNSNQKSSQKDSEDPTEDANGDQMEVQTRESLPFGAKQSKELQDYQIRFVLGAERYLIGLDIRGIVHLEGERFGVVAWNDNKVYSIDREKPEAVIQFNMPPSERNCISMRLIPFYDANQFPFAVVLTQTSICCIDFKRYNAFKICPWKYKGVPNNVNQLEMHLSQEDDQVGEQINIVTLEFDGSNSYVRRLVLDHDCIQALNFLGQD